MKNKILFFYFVLTAVLIADFVSYSSSSISLKGKLSDLFLFWTWLILTIVIIYLFWNRKMSKIYLSFLAGLFVLSTIPMALPLIALIGFSTGETSSHSFQLNDKYEVQQHSGGAMAMPKIQLIKSNGILEKVIAERDFEIEYKNNYYTIADASSMQVKETEDSINVVFTFKDGSFDWRILSK